jgi:RNA polymerase sigma-70 factor (ECF subfamily)
LKTPEKDISDEELLTLMRTEGSEAAGYNLLLARYRHRLYWQIRRLVYDHEDASDVLQNCLIRVFRSLSEFEGRSKLYTWLCRIALNEAISFLNKKKQPALSLLEEEAAQLRERLRADPYFEGDEVQLLLQEAIARLPEKQRIVFNLRYFEDMSYADMALVLDTSEGALKASYHHAVKKIESFVKASQ